jgi:bacillithiol system protein YtxJ
MKPQTLQLQSDPESALTQLKSASQAHPVVVFKKSPTCPISHRAEAEFRSWLASHDGASCSFAIVDVIEERPLARGLTTALDIKHESPQALVFKDGQLAWHDSHDKLTGKKFAEWIG